MRKVIAALSLLVLTATMPAHAAAPANDNYADATGITALPFTDTVDVTEATVEPIEAPSCGPIGHTVWYTITPANSGTIVLDSVGSDFDTILGVYSGADLLTASEVACNDDAGEAGSISRLTFDAQEGETYHIEAGGWAADAGSLTVNASLPGTIAGTVTNEDTEPLEGICVYVESASFDPPYYWFGSQTDPDGTYTVPDIMPGDYKVSFWDCYEGTYLTEYYADKPDFESADTVTVASAATTVINAELAKAPVYEEPEIDLAVTSIHIDNIPLRTDDGEIGYTGWMRSVHVNIANLTDNDAIGGATVYARACPVTFGGCTNLGYAYLDSPAHSTGEAVFKWNGFGSVGDYRVEATVSTPCQRDTDYRNDSMTVDHYVIVGGTGFGVAARSGGGPVQPVFFFPPIYACRVVVVASAAE